MSRPCRILSAISAQGGSNEEVVHLCACCAVLQACPGLEAWFFALPPPRDARDDFRRMLEVFWALSIPFCVCVIKPCIASYALPERPHAWLCGTMDSASPYGGEGSRFDPWQSQFCPPWPPFYTHLSPLSSHASKLSRTQLHPQRTVRTAPTTLPQRSTATLHGNAPCNAPRSASQASAVHSPANTRWRMYKVTHDRHPNTLAPR